MPEWVKTSESLPEEGVPVIAGWKSAAGSVKGVFVYSDGKWWDGMFKVVGVTVWMPFPEMPE